jgi:hypothetical protein
MKKYILHRWLPLMMLVVIITAGCSKKVYAANSVTDTEDKYEEPKSDTGNNYTPPPIIFITDEQAKSNKDGELYYDDELGYRYWRSVDGTYCLDAKYAAGASPNKRNAKKKLKEIKKLQEEKKGYEIVAQ